MSFRRQLTDRRLHNRQASAVRDNGARWDGYFEKKIQPRKSKKRDPWMTSARTRATPLPR
ncbi:hypothetical protein DESC_610175 [Desulfosarcina cetonica]|nr:hypothetical protein DESC_610175 [Desulfosarcina cetonica]